MYIERCALHARVMILYNRALQPGLDFVILSSLCMYIYCSAYFDYSSCVREIRASVNYIYGDPLIPKRMGGAKGSPMKNRVHKR